MGCGHVCSKTFFRVCVEISATICNDFSEQIIFCLWYVEFSGADLSNATTFMWIFSVHDSVEPPIRTKRQSGDEPRLVFELSGLDSKGIVSKGSEA